MSDYPECDKLRAVSQEISVISEFIEWLEAKGIVLAKYEHHGYHDDRLNPSGLSVEALTAEFFDVDMKVVEEERRAILDAFREATS